MAFGNSTIWDVRSTGDDTNNGGGFDPGNTSMATDLAATSATTASPVCTSASYNFASRDIGAWLFIKSGTNWTPGWYQISAVGSNAATLTAGVGTAMLWNATSNSSGLSTAAGCATTASPTSGTWSIDYSQSTGPGITYTDMVIDGTTNTKYTSSLNPVGPNVVGNIIAVTSGTGFTVQRVEVNSVSGTTATCDKSLGTLSSTGGHGGLGGTLATPGLAGGLVSSASMVVFLKSGSTYSMTNNNNVSGGKFSASPTLMGWGANRIWFDTGTRPTVQSNGNSFVLIDMGGSNGPLCANIIIANGNSNTSITGLQHQFSTGRMRYCSVANVASGILMGSGGMVYGCDVSGITGANGIQVGANGYVDTCTSTNGGAMNCSGSGGFARNSIVNGTNNKSTGFHTFYEADSCTAYNCTGATSSNNRGFDGCITIRNCYAELCSDVGYGGGSAAAANELRNCAGYNNGSNYDATIFTPGQVIGFQALSASGMTAAGSANFVPNSTAGAGALLRGGSYPATFPGLSSTANARDIGAAQHSDPAGGGLLRNPQLSGAIQ